MSNPIADNVEYFIEQEEHMRQRQQWDSHQQGDHQGFLFGPYGHPILDHHHPTDRHNNQATGSNTSLSSTDSSHQDDTDEDAPYLAKRWHSLMRRMSVTIQREEGTPEHAIRSGTPQQPTDHERQLMLTIPIPPSMDDHLPSIDEVVQENARAVKMAELKPSYFEHPFESDDHDDSEGEQQQIQLQHSTITSNSHISSNHSIHEVTSTQQQPLVSNQQGGDHDYGRFSHHHHPLESHAHPLLPKWSTNYDSRKVSPDIQPNHSLQPGGKSHGDVDHQDDRKARAQWGKSIEKIRIMNSFVNAHQRRSSIAPHMWTKYPLAPYYPSAFAVPHIAYFSRDEHGRRPPPILFDILQVGITDSEIDTSAKRLWTFRIELHYGEIKWVIKRTIIEFYNLHLTLKFKAAGIGSHLEQPPSFPSQLAHLCNAALTSMRISRGEEDDDMSTDVNIKRRGALEQYLKDLVHNSRLIVNYDLCEFLELSAVSIVKDMGWKGKEGYLEHKINPTSLKLSNAFRWMNHWSKEWILLRDSYIAFCKDIGSTAPSEVLLFDRHVKIDRGHGSFSPYHQTHITISNSTRRIEIKGPTNRHVEEWMECLDTIKSKSPWIRNHRFGSFAPIRPNAKVKWFVDGHEYFEAVADALLSAKSEIYIEDWWLYLRRPPKGNEEYRLDRLLKRKALEGVMIYVVIYRNVSVALPLDSQHTRDWLQNIHKNIKVLRHSDMTSPLWAHHEKILVIDCRLAFIGGLDLCFGRYDTQAHDLTDYSPGGECLEIFPGQDYSNPRIKDFIKVSQYNKEVIDKQSAPRMPWHDIHTAMVGQPARDVGRHFIQRWNYIKSTHAKDKDDIPFLLPKGEYVAPQDEAKFRGTCRVQVIRSSAEWSLGIRREYSIYNAYMECISRAKHFIYIENQFFITATQSGDKLIKNKIGEAIVDRIKRAHHEKQKFRIIVVIPSAPGFEGDFASGDRRSMPLRSVAHYQYMSISRGGNSVLEKLHQENIPAEDYISFYSLRNWGRIKKSSAAKMVSPMASGIQLDPSSPTSTASGIDASRKGSMDQATNGMYGGFNNSTSNISTSTNAAATTHKPISKKKSKIRNSVSSLAIMRNNGGGDSGGTTNDDQHPSTQHQRQRSRSNSEDRWDTMSDGRMEFVTEQVYIHSKLMIVDDKTVICGSANLNDRSQLGNRDSEIAVVIEDTDMVTSKMNGKEYLAGRFALTLRMHLFKEHLGLLSMDDCTSLGNTHAKHRYTALEADNLVMDPLDDSFIDHVWNLTAETNTIIYRNVFHCVPDDSVLTFDSHRRFVPDPARIPPGHIANPWRMNHDDVMAKLNKIKGHLVVFPTQYLSQENMTASLVQEATPPTVFT
ncbi:hypothetical protein [Absidia glauca]|uniref:Phospholipase n=1 Tax=Absidia glauca TaxID=4829 RepID=A0A168LNF0_ABSGL|nr:hypothetical protein [Absidia glauca]